MTIDQLVRQLVREELASLLEEPRKAAVQVDDVARARARQALRRLGVELPTATARPKK